MLRSDYKSGLLIKEVAIDHEVEQSRLAVVEVHQEVALAPLLQHYAGRLSEQLDLDGEELCIRRLAVRIRQIAGKDVTQTDGFMSGDQPNGRILRFGMLDSPGLTPLEQKKRTQQFERRVVFQFFRMFVCNRAKQRQHLD